MAKNARNSLIAAGGVARETAPSYFLVSLLWNVPDQSFGNGLQNAYQRAIQLHWVARPGAVTAGPARPAHVPGLGAGRRPRPSASRIASMHRLRAALILSRS